MPSNVSGVAQWTQMYPRLEQLCKNRALTAGDIAEMLTEEFQLAVPLTRHAVIGKIYRNGLRRIPTRKPLRVAVIGHGVMTEDPPPPPPPPTDGVSITELATRHCRWPSVGEGATMLYCGADRIVGTPYCREHARMAYHGKR